METRETLILFFIINDGHNGFIQFKEMYNEGCEP